MVIRPCFPEELPRRLMKLFSYKNDIVLDPFNGAGTTTLVAWKLHRRFIVVSQKHFPKKKGVFRTTLKKKK